MKNELVKFCGEPADFKVDNKSAIIQHKAPTIESGECLVTDLVHELSSRLEIPLLLDENIRTEIKKESPLDTAFYEEQIKETWDDDPCFNFVNTYENTFSMQDDNKNDLTSFLDENAILKTHCVNASSGSGSGSGSECSSTEIWITKNELDTPPITPPDERISPQNIFLLPSDELRFVPICGEGSPKDEIKVENNSGSCTKKIRIQPKPVSTSLNILDSQTLDFPTVLCNVFNDNLNSEKNREITVNSQLFVNSNLEKKSILSKKDLELLQAKRKQERMIRNRESAYLSRKRKKEHVAHLEKQVQDLQTQNKQLILENQNLRRRLAKYEESESFFGKKHGKIFTDSPRKTTALLALLFTVCLNVGSFSSLINERKAFKSNDDIIKENLVPTYGSDLHSSRSLLWANSDFDLNSTYSNLTKTSCPLSVNQTESIRLESELRRWIGVDNDFSRHTKHNISKISQYFLLGERPKQQKNISKRKRRILKPSFQKKKLEMYQINNLYFNTFFEAIHRRDDTFYLVSFSSDHLLLPALSHNQTTRPKMSLMLPASFSNGTGLDQVEMMQIDCEVTNTQLLSVNENDIPSHMRPYSNTTDSKNEPGTKSKDFEGYFDLPVPLVPGKQKNFEIEENNLSYESSRNNSKTHFKLSPSQSIKTNLSSSGDIQVRNFHNSQLNFNMTHNNFDLYNKTTNTFLNESYKQDVYIESTKKNLLKWLKLGSTTTSPGAIKFSPKKSFYKSFKNITKLLFN